MKNKKFNINLAAVNQPAKLAPLIAAAMAIVTQSMQVVGYAAVILLKAVGGDDNEAAKYFE